MKKIAANLTLLVLCTLLTACTTIQKQVQTPSTTQTSTKHSSTVEEKIVDLVSWNRYYTQIEVIEDPNLAGYLALETENKASLNRNVDEFVAWREGKPLQAIYDIIAIDEKKEVTSFEFPKTASDFKKISIQPEVQIDFKISQKEINRVKTKISEEAFTLFGYKTKEGHLVLTDGKEDKPTVYVYQSNTSKEFTVITDKAAVRKDPKFSSESLKEIENSQVVTTVGAVFGEEKDGKKEWLEIKLDNQVGYIWSGDVSEKVEKQTNTSSNSASDSPAPHISASVPWSHIQSAALAEAMLEFGDQMGQQGYVIVDRPDKLTFESGASFDGYQVMESYQYSSGSTTHRYFFVTNPSGQPEVLYSTGGTVVKPTANELLPRLYAEVLSGVRNMSDGVILDDIKQGNMHSLGGRWVNDQGTEWMINSKGMLTSGEMLRLSAQPIVDEGIQLELAYRSIVSPVLLIPKGTTHGQSDSSRTRLLLFPEENSDPNAYFYR
ncbi:TPA: hypothetical protein ACGOVA_001329 [Streptococcus suis]